MPWRDWLLVLGGVVLALAAFFAFLPWVIQSLIRVLLWPRYRLRVIGGEHLPKTGPALLALNHLSWFDGFFLAASCPRRGKALVNRSYIDVPIFRPLAIRAGLIPVSYNSLRAQRALFASCRAALDRGEVVAIFPEGQISRNGLTGPFQRGLEVILKDRASVPVIPVYLDNVWGSVWSFSGGRFLKKWPQGWRRTVNIVFGPPVPPPVTTFAVRQAVLAAGVRGFAMRRPAPRPLETIDPSLPHLDHPALGPLTGSTANYDHADIHQIGHKPGTVGLPLPGVALRIVDEAGKELPPDAEGQVQALIAGKPDWAETGLRGSLSADGFLRITRN
jgi:1-acyl-sn-glycerol-3-phosphate acyltransferase